MENTQSFAIDDDFSAAKIISSLWFVEVRRKMKKFAAIVIVFGGLFFIEFEAAKSGQNFIELERRFGNFCDQLSDSGNDRRHRKYL